MLKPFLKLSCHRFLKRWLKRSTQKQAANPHETLRFTETMGETSHRFLTETFHSLPWEGNGETVETSRGAR